jgi:hypothetical protein
MEYRRKKEMEDTENYKVEDEWRKEMEEGGVRS